MRTQPTYYLGGMVIGMTLERWMDVVKWRLDPAPAPLTSPQRPSERVWVSHGRFSKAPFPVFRD